jgi:dihydrofolate reductase
MPLKFADMRKLIISMNLSLDGYLSGPLGELDWHFEKWNDRMGEKLLERLQETDTIILGRLTYEAMAKYWTVKPLEDHFPRQDLAIADKMNHHHKVVFSKTMKEPIWHRSVFVTGDPQAEIKQLKQEKGKDMILFGSGRLASTLIRSGVVDEYFLWIHPVLLGEGRPMFHHLEKLFKLKLKDSTSFESGVVMNYYGRG